jgi:hypothetical protein
MFPMAHMGLPLLPFLTSGRFPRWAPLIALGGLLPDLIDKPLGHLILPENNGRIFAHTLLFALILFASGLLWAKVMPLAYGVVFHHLLDFVYKEPDPTLWPFLGPFAYSDFEYATWIDHLFQPLNLIGEVAGSALLAWWFIGWLNARRCPSKTIYN